MPRFRCHFLCASSHTKQAATQSSAASKMDMDYDIPLPKELESLEANSYFHDDHDFTPDLDLPEQQPPDSPPSIDPQINGHNERPRSDAPDSPLDDTQLPSDEKRTKIVDLDDVEEDRSRYSPAAAVDTEDVRVMGEKILSSYAFEIDGECMPVTARGGDRVYAIMCRFETEERVKNFHFLGMPLPHASSHFVGSWLARLIVISLSKNPRCLDGAAVTVLIIASIYDAIGSIIIGNLFGLVAIFLGHMNRDCLIGRAMHNDDLDKTLHFLKNEPVVDSIYDFKMR